MLAALGEHATTDATGHVRLPRSTDDWVALAHKGDLWGWRVIELRQSAAATIELFTDRTLRVQVLDAANRPVPDVRVWLRMTRGDTAIGGTQETTRGGDGMAVFEHVDVEFSSYYGQVQFDVAVDLVAREPVSAEFEVDPWPSEPLRLRLPTTGSIAVELVDDAGTAFSGDFGVSFRIPFAADAQTRTLTPVFRRSMNGVARLEHVALGLVVDLEAMPYERERTNQRAVSGPTLVGEEVHMRIPLGEREPVLMGRLIDRDRQVLANLLVKTMFSRTSADGGISPSSSRIKTDREGRFRTTVDAGSSPDDVIEFFVNSTDESNRPGLEGHPTLPPVIVLGENDLGDVTMLEARPLLAGRVIDDTGSPIEGATLRLIEIDEQGAFASPSPLVDSTSRADGTFALRGAWPAANVVLAIRKAGFLPLRTGEYAPGTADVELVLTREAALAGRVLCDPGIEVQQIELLVATSGVDPADSGSSDDVIHPGDDGSFEFGGLPAGTATIRATLPGVEEPLATIEGVRTIAGQTARDARMDPLDLRGLLHAIDLEVVAEDGAEIIDGWACALSPVPDARISAQLIVDGRVHLVIRGESANVEIGGEECMLAHLEAVRGSQRVVLRRAVPVRLVLDPDVELPRGVTLSVSLVASRDRLLTSGELEIYRRGRLFGSVNRMQLANLETFESSRAVTLLAVYPGKNELQFTLTRHPAGAGVSTYACRAREDCRVIDVDALQPETVTRVAPDPKAYQTALSALEKK
jgi:hypothetical protein